MKFQMGAARTAPKDLNARTSAVVECRLGPTMARMSDIAGPRTPGPSLADQSMSSVTNRSPVLRFFPWSGYPVLGYASVTVRGCPLGAPRVGCVHAPE